MIDGSLQEKDIWLDKRWGQKGYGAWFVPIGLVVFVVKGLFLAGFSIWYWEVHGELAILAVGAFGLIAGFTHAFGMALFIYHGRRTVQSISSEGKSGWRARFYFGSTVYFSAEDVSEIRLFKTRMRIGTPLDMYNDNYRIIFKDNSFFYISGVMPNVSQLITRLGLHSPCGS